MKTKVSSNLKTNFSLSNVFLYLFAVTPVIFTSLYFPQETFPAWAVTIFMASIVFLAVSVTLLYGSVKSKIFSGNILLPIFTVVLGAAAVYTYVLKTTLPLSFVLFGKGISPVSVAAILSLVPVIYLASVIKNRARIVLMTSAFIALALPFLFSILSRSVSGINDIFAFLLKPIISFTSLTDYPIWYVGVYGYPFWYAAAVLLGLALGCLFEKRKIAVKDISVLSKVVLILMVCLAAGWVTHNTVRLVAGTYYVKAYTAASINDLDVAKSNLDKANSIAPFDMYYLGLVDVDLAKLQSTTASTSQEEIAQRLANMTKNAQAAFTYDPSNNLPLFYLYNIYKMIGMTDQEEIILKELSVRLPNNLEIQNLLKELTKTSK